MKLKRKLIRNNRQRPSGTSASFVSARLRPTAFASYSIAQGFVRASTMFQHTKEELYSAKDRNVNKPCLTITFIA